MIDDFETRLRDQQTKLAAATQKLSVSNEQMRLKDNEFKKLKKTWATETSTCHGNYENFESQMCGLKKIRGELYKMKGGDSAAFFQDCSVSEWEGQECSKSCAKGVMVLTRSIVTPPKGGTKCPPLAKSKECNFQKCPIDCQMSDWEGWSECSSDCGGGLKERMRDVVVKPRYNGDSCTQTTEAQSCNMHACDADCVLSDWSAWSDCSKMCGGGTSFRRKYIMEKATGAGQCWSEDDKERQQDKACNDKPCMPKLSTLRCETALDVVLLLDGSGSVGSQGWEATKDTAVKLANAFHAHHEDIKVAVITYSGPSTWREVEACGGDTPPFAWTRMYAKGYYGWFNWGGGYFNSLFRRAHLGIVRRQCMWCRYTHRDIYFRWYGDASIFDAWDRLMVTWTDRGFHSDFDIFSTLADALAGTRPWRKCNGNDRGIGFPRDCGPYRLTGWQWQSLTRGGQSHLKWSALTKVEVDMEKDCKIKFVQHFTNNTKALVDKIKDLEWPRGSTLTAQALLAAEEELPLSGRSDAQSVVVALTDGKPVSLRKAQHAAEDVRKRARMFWIAVTRYAPTSNLMQWASKPSRENVVQVNSWKELDTSATVNHIISDVCPQVS
eukprot:TRINITY_DN4071_c0_g3_i1.p1 TRINITY_DN4071_c0_g3~~TRINITY_DN4071_c0_g3_i1.p1  ORF type:complete len:654 (+),score=148.39 TRINITY_DN4071_c0_g3_i1:140-1963(+)